MTSTAAIQRTLHLIVPTASTLPPSLIDHATSLLAQSRAKAPTLKPDEEIARTFACCHIACERLKTRLALEIGKVGPPCGPRIYKKLYSFLDSALPAAPSTPRTNRIKDVEATPASGRSARQAASVGASGSRATPGSLGKRTRAAAPQPAGSYNLPRFTMPLIRHVCTSMGESKMATHIYAGVESVYRSLQSKSEALDAPEIPIKRRKSNNGDSGAGNASAAPVPSDEQVPALIVAVYLIATTKRTEEGSADEEASTKAQAAVGSYLEKQKSAPVSVASEALKRDAHTYLQAAERGWRDMEWYGNIPRSEQEKKVDGATNGGHGDEPATPRKRPAKTPLRRREKHSQRMIDDNDHGPAGLLPGLGTMFQPAVDWLSDERQADFEMWKQEMLSSVAAVEQEG